jgi:hypothetical protein
MKFILFAADLTLPAIAFPHRQLDGRGSVVVPRDRTFKQVL